MALAKRIIPCLDVDNGRVVKGVKFENIRDAGDPVEIARRYDEQGADEITFLDITASVDGRDTTLHTVERMASQVFIPLTVGGGVRTVQDIRNLLNAGADKVSINTAAVLIETLSAPALSRLRMSCTVRTPPPTVSGMNTWLAMRSTVCNVVSRPSTLAVISRKVISSAPCSS